MMVASRPRPTLDQERALYCWKRASERKGVESYREMAKGAPALVMGSGLMASLAFWHSRSGTNKKAGRALVDDILGWLAKRKITESRDFTASMRHFAESDSIAYMHATDETLAMLKWLRQFSDAIEATETQ